VQRVDAVLQVRPTTGVRGDLRVVRLVVVTGAHPLAHRPRVTGGPGLVAHPTS
jgi:hypothetical protein